MSLVVEVVVEVLVLLLSFLQVVVVIGGGGILAVAVEGVVGVTGAGGVRFLEKDEDRGVEGDDELPTGALIFMGVVEEEEVGGAVALPLAGSLLGMVAFLVGLSVEAVAVGLVAAGRLAPAAGKVVVLGRAGAAGEVVVLEFWLLAVVALLEVVLEVGAGGGGGL